MYNELVRLCNHTNSVLFFQMKFTVINYMYNTIPTNIRNNILKDMKTTILDKIVEKIVLLD